jgi:hypothetical protein
MMPSVTDRRMKSHSRLATCIALGLWLAALPTSAAAGERREFPETGQASENAFYDFWQANGDVAVLGFPISPTFRYPAGDGSEIVMQVYERAVLEWHPENPPESRVELRRLGDELLDVLLPARAPGQRSGAILRAFPPDPCDDVASGCTLFAETNHTLRQPFLDFWQAHGGLAIFGLPLTEAFDLQDPATGETLTVQYFERARLEYHPTAEGDTVLIGLLGDAFWKMHRDGVLAHPETLVTVPDATSTDPWLPTTG